MSLSSRARSGRTAGAVLAAVVTVSGLLAVPAEAATPPPTVTKLNPTAGKLAKGTVVTIAGANFVGTPTVAFGTTRGTSVKLLSHTRLQVTAPAHRAGVVDVRVTTKYGTSKVVTADRYTYFAPPTVTAVTPPGGDRAGGDQVTITGSNFYGRPTVRFGTMVAEDVEVASKTRLTATVPKHASGAVNVQVSTASGTGTKTGAYRYLGAWSAGTLVEAPQGQADTVSCAVSFCMALDAFDNVFVRRGSGAWTRQTIPGSEPGLEDVSCTSNSGTVDCVVVGRSIYHFRQVGAGTPTWTTIKASDPDYEGTQLPTASCVGTYCQAIYQDGTYRTSTDAGATWAAQKATTGEPFLFSMSCTSSTFCAALVGDVQNAVWFYNGTKWTKGAAKVETTSVARELSCVSPTACVAVDDKGRVMRWNGSTWQPIQVGQLDDNTQQYEGLSNVSCVVGGGCAAAGWFGNLYRTTSADAAQWSKSIESGFTAGPLGCGGSSCTVTDGQFSVDLSLTDGAVSAQTLIAGQQLGLRALSCAPDGTCATTSGGHTVTLFEDGQWTPPRLVLPYNAYFTDVACADGPFCMAVADDGTYSTWDGGDWSAPALTSQDDDAAYFLQSVSCASADFCVATGTNSAYTWRRDPATGAASWTAHKLDENGDGVRSVACYATSSCVVTGDGAWWRTTDGTTFKPQAADSLPEFNERGRVSCTATGFCAVVDANRVFALASASATTWASKTLSTNDDLYGVSCAGASSFCLVITYGSDVYARYGSGTWIHGSIDPSDPVPARTVSCRAAETCTVGAENGKAYDYTSGTG